MLKYLKLINRYISVIEANIGLLYREIKPGIICKSCHTRNVYIKYNRINPKTGKWNYEYTCSFCGNEID